MGMEVAFKEKREVWRGRGHPRRVIPPAVRQLADDTYNNPGKVGVVTFGAEDRPDVDELCRLLRSYAKSLGLVMRIQRDDDEDQAGDEDQAPTFELRFEMADKPRKKATP